MNVWSGRLAAAGDFDISFSDTRTDKNSLKWLEQPHRILLSCVLMAEISFSTTGLDLVVASRHARVSDRS